MDTGLAKYEGSVEMLEEVIREPRISSSYRRGEDHPVGLLESVMAGVYRFSGLSDMAPLKRRSRNAVGFTQSRHASSVHLPLCTTP